MVDVLNLLDLVVVELEFGQGVESPKVLNFLYVAKAKAQAFCFSEVRLATLLLQVLCWAFKLRMKRVVGQSS